MINDNINFEFPLQWLLQQPKTKYPKSARFGNHTIFNAGNLLVKELRMLGAKNCIITSDLRIKDNGMLHGKQSQPDNKGVVVYFDLKGKPKAMACDKWDKIDANIWALVLSIRSIRGLERWGGSEFLDGLFTGFKALPETSTFNCVNYFSDFNSKVDAKNKYVELVKSNHPDVGGNPETFMEIKRQYDLLRDD